MTVTGSIAIYFHLKTISFNVFNVQFSKKMMREKTKLGIIDHICNLKMTDEHLLLGSSHVERLVWKFPHLAPANTWLCGIGGDKAFQLAYRVHNANGCGYTQHRRVQNKFKTIGILIGGNDMTQERMTDEDIVGVVKHVECMHLHLSQRWPDAEMKVFPILPVRVTGRERNKENYDDYNRKLVMSGLVKCDANFAWDLNPENDFEDDVHLNESGYKKFTNQIMKELL